MPIFAAVPSILAEARYEEFVRDHSPILAVLFILLLALLVVRLVMRTMTRMILLGLLTMMVLFVYVERHDIQECTQSCSCSIAGAHITLPACDPARI